MVEDDFVCFVFILVFVVILYWLESEKGLLLIELEVYVICDKFVCMSMFYSVVLVME